MARPDRSTRGSARPPGGRSMSSVATPWVIGLLWLVFFKSAARASAEPLRSDAWPRPGGRPPRLLRYLVILTDIGQGVQAAELPRPVYCLLRRRPGIALARARIAAVARRRRSRLGLGPRCRRGCRGLLLGRRRRPCGSGRSGRR